MASTDFTIDDQLIAKVTNYIKKYMGNYDPSHDFSHIQRVLNLARRIQASEPSTSLPIVTLCALLHDVGDRKYLKPGEDATRMVHDLLVSYGVPEPLADKVQTICLGVSYSSEIKDPARVVELIRLHPELAVVQDADRLDAIGAVGIGRCFTFGGAKNRPMSNSIEHFADKLVKLEGMMKTDMGRKMARDRTARIEQMQEWWRLEAEETLRL